MVAVMDIHLLSRQNYAVHLGNMKIDDRMILLSKKNVVSCAETSIWPPMTAVSVF